MVLWARNHRLLIKGLPPPPHPSRPEEKQDNSSPQGGRACNADPIQISWNSQECVFCCFFFFGGGGFQVATIADVNIVTDRKFSINLEIMKDMDGMRCNAQTRVHCTLKERTTCNSNFGKGCSRHRNQQHERVQRAQKNHILNKYKREQTECAREQIHLIHALTTHCMLVTVIASMANDYFLQTA